MARRGFTLLEVIVVKKQKNMIAVLRKLEKSKPNTHYTAPLPPPPTRTTTLTTTHRDKFLIITLIS
jgi:hypothetical protein